MTVPDYSQADFLAQFQALLPNGPVWPRDSDAVLTKALDALMPTYVRQAARSANLLIDAFPSTSVELLPEWEDTLGLPDPCTMTNASIQQRQAAVTSKLIGIGGQSIAYFTAFAAALGFAVTVTEFSPFVVGELVGLPDYGPAWAFAWEVSAPQVPTFYFDVGSSFAGDPLETYDAGELVCRLSRIAPGHTILFFSFT